MSRFTLILLLLVGSVPLFADVYRSVDEQGNVSYSDTPQSGSEKVEIRNPTIIPATDVNKAFRKDKPTRPKALPYSSVAIVAPQDQQTIRDNVGNISVVIQIEPRLQSNPFGHRVKLLFNGSPVGEPSSALRHTLPAVDRGTHTLQAVVVDARGTALAKSAVTEFFVQKHSILNP